MNTRTFHYIDAMPGAGKTEYFVNKAAKLLRDGGDYILVYVAPTARLLHETYRRLQSKVGYELMLAKVQVVAEPHRVSEAFHSTPYKVIGDQPTVALNYMFDLITRQQYVDTKYRVGFSHSLQANAQLGHVVMTTHESFVRINRQDQTGHGFALLGKMIVVFDEARKCVMQPSDFKIPKDQWSMLWKSLTVDTVDSETPAFRKKRELPPIQLAAGVVPHTLYRIKQVEPLKRILEIFGVKLKSLLPPEVKDMLAMYREYAETGRGSIYILSTVNLDEMYEPLASKEKISVQIVMRPTALFDNYQHVILTSAFFTDSQMYHFLKKDGHKLVPMLKPKKLGPALAAIKERSERLRKSAAERLHVATLLNSDMPSRPGPKAYKENLTSTLLTTGMVLPRALEVQARGALDRSLSHREIVYNLAQVNGPSVSEDPDIDARLRDWAVPPLWVLLFYAAVIVRRWMNKYGKPGQRSLLTLNVNDKKVWLPNGTRYLRTVKFTLAHGTLDRKAGHSNSDVYDDKHLRDSALIPDLWRTRLKESLYDRLKTSTFTVPQSPALHGINRYSKMCAFTHMAALNPSPTQTRFYRMLIPDYDVDQDHSIENLVQTLYRTSLRDPDAADPVLMVIPYESSARLLATKIGIRSFKKEVNKPPLTTLSHVKLMGEEAREHQRQRTQEVNRKYDKDLSSEVDKARARVIAARANLKKAPDSKARQATLARHETAFEILKAKATLKGK